MAAINCVLHSCFGPEPADGRSRRAERCHERAYRNGQSCSRCGRLGSESDVGGYKIHRRPVAAPAAKTLLLKAAPKAGVLMLRGTGIAAKHLLPVAAKLALL